MVKAIRWRLLWLTGIFCLLLSQERLVAMPQVIDGVLDLRAWDTDRHAVLGLDGNWKFYWQSFLSSDTKNAPSALIKVPGSWNYQGDYSLLGYATYQLEVYLSEPRSIALLWPTIYSSARILIDGMVVKEIGRPTTDQESYIMQLSEQAIVLNPRKAHFQLSIEVANYDVFLAGFAKEAPSLGVPEAIFAKKEQQNSITMIIFGTILIMSLYHFALFIINRKNWSTLFFGIFCLCVDMYLLAAKGRPISIFFPEISAFAQILMFNIWVLSTPFFLYFMSAIFPNYIKRRYAHALLLVHGFYFCMIWVLDLPLFLRLSVLIQLSTLVVTTYGVWQLVRAVRDRAEGSITFAIGVCLLIVTAANDILLSRAIINSVPIGGPGLVSFIFCQSFLLARRFSNAFVRVKQSERKITVLSQQLQEERDHVLELNQSLEKRVDEKTRDIRSFMTHLKLGIFAIEGEQLQIHADYSEHLKVIFHRDDLTGMRITNLLFDHSDLSADDIDQAVNALQTSLGESLVTFDANMHCLPKEIHWSESSHDRQILEASWNPVTDTEGQVEKILITIRDVTSLRALEQTAVEKKQNLEFLNELLNVEAERFRIFVLNCRQFLEQNRQIIATAMSRGLDAHLLKTLFVNTHTMKGAARSLHLKKLAEDFHNLEQSYVEYQSLDFKNVNPESMLEEQNKLETLLEYYVSLNEHQLGRRLDDERRIEFSESELSRIYQDLQLVATKGMLRNLGADFDKLEPILKRFFNDLFKPAESVFREIFADLPRLAKDLGKPTPELIIAADELYLSSEAEMVFRNIFVHIMRNSVDHGIETAEERTKLGKPSHATIHIELLLRSDCLQLIYEDDGRGLDLEKIAQKARTLEILNDRNSDNDHTLADLIFHPGFSTASQVGEISGRGVGMSAVRQFLSDAGGSIEIVFSNKVSSSQRLRPFAFVLSVPKSFVATMPLQGTKRIAS